MPRQMTEYEWGVLGSNPLCVIDFAKGGFGEIFLKANSPDLKSFYEAMPEDERQQHLNDRIKQNTKKELLKVEKEMEERQIKERQEERNRRRYERRKKKRGES